MKLNKKLQLVYDVIQNNPGVENDDVRLLEAVWLREGWQDDKSLYWNLSRVTRSETVTRRRRDLHVMGLIQYSGEADQARKEAFENERNAHSNHEQVKAEIVNPKYKVVTIDGELVTVLV